MLQPPHGLPQYSSTSEVGLPLHGGFFLGYILILFSYCNVFENEVDLVSLTHAMHSTDEGNQELKYLGKNTSIADIKW